jgi:hypothetical protein
MKKIPMVERFEKAVRDHEMAGAQPPDDRLLIEAEYREAKMDMIAALRIPVSAICPTE